MERTKDYFDIVHPSNQTNRFPFVHKDKFILESIRINTLIANIACFLELAFKSYLGLDRNIEPSSLSFDPLQIMLDELPFMNDSQKDHMDMELTQLIKKTLDYTHQLAKYTEGSMQLFEVRRSIVKILEFAIMDVANKHKQMNESRLQQKIKVELIDKSDIL
jgi:hypothetical protein